MTVKMILAKNDQGVIGQAGVIPWHVPEDLALFKKKTQGHVVVMGSKTWYSLPEKARPLPGRINVVFSKQPSSHFGKDRRPDHVCSSEGQVGLPGLISALERKYPDKDIWVIGGSQIYSLLMPLVQEIHETVVLFDVAKGPKDGPLDFAPTHYSGFQKTVHADATAGWLVSSTSIYYRVNVYARLDPNLKLNLPVSKRD